MVQKVITLMCHTAGTRRWLLLTTWCLANEVSKVAGYMYVCLQYLSLKF